nr:hypothetical protein [Actinomycetota bacterium]
MSDQPGRGPEADEPDEPDQPDGGPSGSPSAPGPAEELTSALEQAANAPTLLVASDFDGALAEFTVDPEDSKPAPGAMAALRGLAALP